ncbi:hypothetical protein EDD21DRAFT_420543 [Dissophora ornata]|nr:hypothetical protein BGZ58_003140 [Dissophora ornata]KAI8595560.1 hypothetical protein EDD21DRAFT_420543 [Dissophora ornata]
MKLSGTAVVLGLIAAQAVNAKPVHTSNSSASGYPTGTPTASATWIPTSATWGTESLASGYPAGTLTASATWIPMSAALSTEFPPCCCATGVPSASDTWVPTTWWSDPSSGVYPTEPATSGAVTYTETATVVTSGSGNTCTVWTTSTVVTSIINNHSSSTADTHHVRVIGRGDEIRRLDDSMVTS